MLNQKETSRVSVARVQPALLLALTAVLVVMTTTGCGSKLPSGKVKITGVIMLDGSPLVCEGEGEAYVNLVSDTGANGGGASPFDRSTGGFEMIIQPGKYNAVIRATDGFIEEDVKRGRVISAKSLIPEKYSLSDESDTSITVSPTGGDVSIQLSSE